MSLCVTEDEMFSPAMLETSPGISNREGLTPVADYVGHRRVRSQSSPSSNTEIVVV